MKYKKIILIIAVLLFAAFAVSPWRIATPETFSGVKWDGTRTIERSITDEYIAIPGFSDLYFQNDSEIQSVNIYNPEENDFSMDIEIVLSDGTVLWYTKDLMPGYGFYEIDLLTTLNNGTYDAAMNIKCYSIETGAEVNGCSFAFKIIVE